MTGTDQEFYSAIEASSPPAQRNIAVGRDALGNVFVSGDRNDVRVTLVVADQRLLAELTVKSEINPYRGLDAFYETDARFFLGRQKLVRRAWVLFQIAEWIVSSDICGRWCLGIR